jgi:hypothetical protein
MTLVAASGSTASATRFGPMSIAATGSDALVRLSLVGGLGLLLAVGLLLITAGCGPPN